MRKLLFAGAMLALVSIPAAMSLDLAPAEFTIMPVASASAIAGGGQTDFMVVPFYAEAVNLVAAEDPVDTIVSIPWGDWLYDSATTLIAIIGAIMAWGIRKLPARLVAIAQTDQVEQLLRNAIGYGVNTTAGAAKGKSLTIDVGNEVLEKALQYAIDNGPRWLISWAGGEEGIKGKIIARLDLDAKAAAPEVVR